MNITIPNSVLDNIFTSLQPFLDKKDSSQITSHIYLETKDNQLICKATDFEIGLCAISDSLTINEHGIATVNGKQALDIIKRLKESDVNLYTHNENLHIQQNKSSFKLPMFNAQEFPTFPEYENLPKLEINSLQLITSMKKIFPVIDINNQKRELNGALLDIKEYSYNFVATDTKRLAMVKFDNASGNNLALIFPKKQLQKFKNYSLIILNFSITKKTLSSNLKITFSFLILSMENSQIMKKYCQKKSRHSLRFQKQKLSKELKLLTL